MKTLLFLILSAAAFAQTSVNPRAVTLTADGVAVAQSFMLTQVNNLQGVTVNGALDAVTTTVTVSDVSNIKNGDELLIDGEAMAITAKANKVLTVTRGDLGTTAIVHANNAKVDTLVYPTLKEYASQSFINNVQANAAAVIAGTLPCPTCSATILGSSIAPLVAAQKTAKSTAAQ